MKLQRRQLLKAAATLPLIHYFSGCAPEDTVNATPSDNSKADQTGGSPPTTPIATPVVGIKPGVLSIIQGPTSDRETLINIFSPRLRNFKYEVTDDGGQTYTVDKYEVVKGPLFYNIDKIKVSGLSPLKKYKLLVYEASSSSSAKSIYDERFFQTLDTSQVEPRFALVSCMADDPRFNDFIDPMWDRLEKENVDFIALTGDLVYVDDKSFVERQKATELDIWQRYTDSFKRIPLYHWQNLKPVFATWDDHDFGTNDGDRNFIAKDAATKLFKAAFFGPEITGDAHWKQGPQGTCSQFQAYGQKFFFLDDRSQREPNKATTAATAPYGHWGEDQHRWLMDGLKQDATPAWIFNGNQFFDGAHKTFIESLEQNHPAEFKTFTSELQTLTAPIAFGSGDVHLSEIMKIPKSVIGFDSYEFTSSSMHSYTGSGWDNKYRVDGAYTKDFNFVVFKSVVRNGGFQINAKSLGLPKTPYFDMDFQISR